MIQGMKILFVYNADSGRVNTWLDIGHKLLSPQTYSCNLCSITHGVFAEREEWKSYRESSELELEFLHRDEFEAKYPDAVQNSYPVILKGEDNGLEVIASTEQINAIASIEELIGLLPKSA